MKAHLNRELEQMVRVHIEKGHYNGASDVVCDALRLLADRDELLHARRRQIDDKIDEGLRQLDRGEGIDGHEFFERLEREEALLAAKLRPA